MTDPRNQPEQEDDHEGASPGELLIEAARRNNTDLLQEVLDSCSPEKAADLLNNTKSVLGNHIYHEAALRGNYEIIDILLDQDNFECDPINRIERDTPLHSAVRYINTLPQPLSDANLSAASALLSMMCEAGSDARIRNKAQLTAAQLVDPLNPSLKKQLEEAMEVAGDDGGVFTFGATANDDDGEGSASDSDFDLEEYKREKERRKVAASKA